MLVTLTYKTTVVAKYNGSIVDLKKVIIVEPWIQDKLEKLNNKIWTRYVILIEYKKLIENLHNFIFNMSMV